MWRDVVDFALDQETERSVEEQMQWIAREPHNPVPYYHLAQLRRMQYRQQVGLALLLEAVRLDDRFAPAHVALTEMYAVCGDYEAAWRHARAAESAGDAAGVRLLERHKV
jgi:hypothetical protein